MHDDSLPYKKLESDRDSRSQTKKILEEDKIINSEFKQIDTKKAQLK